MSARTTIGSCPIRGHTGDEDYPTNDDREVRIQDRRFPKNQSWWSRRKKGS